MWRVCVWWWLKNEGEPCQSDAVMVVSNIAGQDVQLRWVVTTRPGTAVDENNTLDGEEPQRPHLPCCPPQ